jgi:mRNA-degrading endonuclease toxin of MazEF toxin-antitoxin module
MRPRFVTYKRWDVVAVHFPFIEGTDAKRRPALIVSSDRLRASHAIYWVVMITTAKSGSRSDDVPVSNRERAGLPENCVIRVPRIAAIGDTRIARRIGEILPKDRNAVSALLRQFVP